MNCQWLWKVLRAENLREPATEKVAVTDNNFLLIYNPSASFIIQFFTSVCVLILYMSGGTYSLNSTRNDRFLVNRGNFIYKQGFC